MTRPRSAQQREWWRAGAPKVQTVGAIVALAAALSNCTTFVQATTCQLGSSSCGGVSDARFCEYVATALEGADCAGMALVVARPFCVVTVGACVDTSYAVRDHDCKVLQYASLRDDAWADCPPGAPMFVSR
jgi:hypothetical protein